MIVDFRQLPARNHHILAVLKHGEGECKVHTPSLHPSVEDNKMEGRKETLRLDPRDRSLSTPRISRLCALSGDESKW